MIELNFIAILVAACTTLVIGFIWYNPKVFGTAWMNASGMTPEKGKGMNMALTLGLTFVLSFVAAIMLHPIVIHQFGVMSVLMAEPGFAEKNATSEVVIYFKDFMSKYGNNFRTFKHGAFHGSFLGITIIMPVIAINAMYERKGFKYVAINAGYWIVSFAIMGGIICAWK